MRTMNAEELANALANALAKRAKDASIPYSDCKTMTDYPFALGYLTGTVQDLLLRMTPDQRETIAKQYGII